MNNKSIFAWGCYAGLSGLWLMLHPNSMLALSDMAPSTEVWPRVLGMVMVVYAGFYFLSDRHDYRAAIIYSGWARLCVLPVMLGFVAIGYPAKIVALGCLDFAGGTWTLLEQRAKRNRPGPAMT